MTNEERRDALNTARRKALRHAVTAEDYDFESYPGQFTQHVRLAEMWAHVAQSLKDGDPKHDAPDGKPIASPVLNTEYGVIER